MKTGFKNTLTLNDKRTGNFTAIIVNIVRDRKSNEKTPYSKGKINHFH